MKRAARRSPAPRRVDFDRTKYGPELLIDVAWVHDMPSFISGDAPHVLTFYDIILITSGRGTFALDGHEYGVKPGTMFFTSPGQIRRWNVRDLDGICLFFSPLFLDEFLSDTGFVRRLPYFHRAPGEASLALPAVKGKQLRRAFEQMRAEIPARRSDATQLLRARLYETLILIGREYAAVHRVAEERTLHPLVVRYLELVQKNVRRERSVAAYADKLGVSPGYLSTLCRRSLGRGAKSVIQEQLSVAARRMVLYSDVPAQDIGYDLGFDDPSYFGRLFRKLTGQPPRAFRKSR